MIKIPHFCSGQLLDASLLEGRSFKKRVLLCLRPKAVSSRVPKKKMADVWRQSARISSFERTVVFLCQPGFPSYNSED